MKVEIENVDLNKNARIAGLVYFFIIAIGMINNLFVLNGVLSPNDITKTTSNIIAKISVFRLSIVLDLLMFLMVTFLSVSLYSLLRSVNKNMALIGFAFRFGESILGGVYVLLSLCILTVVNTKEIMTMNTMEQINSYIQFFLDLKNISFNVLIIFMGVGATIFCWLFYQSKFIPRVISVWGMITYILMTIISFAALLFSNLPTSIVIAVMAPSSLFEITIGLWLCIRGIINNYHKE